MSGLMRPDPGGQYLLKYVNLLAAKFRDFRGFELPSMSIMLHLDRAPGRPVKL